MRRAILADTSPASQPPPWSRASRYFAGTTLDELRQGCGATYSDPPSLLPAPSVIRPAPCAYVYAPSKLTAGYCRCDAMFLRLRAPAIIREPVSCRSVLWIQISDYHGQGSCQMR
jgi:hypothetical protein